MKNVEVDTGQIAAVLPVRADLALQMQEWNLVGRDGSDRSNTSDLWAEERRRGATAACAGWRDTQIRRVVQRANDTLMKSLDAVLLVVADLRQGFDNGPKFEDVILDLLDVDSTRDSVAAGHFFDVSLELADNFADNLRVFDFAVFGDLCMRSSWESNCESEIMERRRGKPHHLCT